MDRRYRSWEFVERSKQDLGLKAQHKMIEITGAKQNSYQVEEGKILFLASKSYHAKGEVMWKSELTI